GPSSTDHEGPERIVEGDIDPLSYGKYPRYLRFVDQQIAKAVTKAARSAVRVVMKLGKTDPTTSPSIAGMQTRTGGRPPQFFDEELRVMQLWNGERRVLDRVVATVVQWNTHPESMESKNTEITSDFPNAVRQAVEQKYGG